MSTPRFNFQKTSLKGVLVVHRKTINDSRGFFSRFYCADELKEAGMRKGIAQINHTRTEAKGTVRGLHFQQPPHAEVKMVSCLKGKIFDLAVDLRQGSPTFLSWHGEILSEENLRSMLIPEGFAHGFQTLEENCELLYLHTEAYCPNAEDALNVADPRLGIEFPLPIAQISDRDRGHAFLTADFTGIVL